MRGTLFIFRDIYLRGDSVFSDRMLLRGELYEVCSQYMSADNSVVRTPFLCPGEGLRLMSYISHNPSNPYVKRRSLAYARSLYYPRHSLRSRLRKKIVPYVIMSNNIGNLLHSR